MQVRFRKVKKEVRILGVDDAPFSRGQKTCKIYGVIYRGATYPDGVVSTTIQVDGNDSTRKLISLVQQTKHHDQLRLVMTGGITMAGFNIINLKTFFEKTHIPIISVIRKQPNLKKFESAVRSFRSKTKLKAYQDSGPISKFNGILYQSCGIAKKDAEAVLKLTCIHAKIPEPLRVAHLIAGGVTTGESRGRA